MEQRLAREIEAANKAYREGHPIMSDAEWDLKMDLLRDLNPNHPLVTTAIIENVKGKQRVQKLPYPMFSLEKVKTIQDLHAWVNQFDDATDFIITPKYDGISLVSLDDEKVWTRGDGTEGQLSNDRFPYMNKGKKICGVSWGEAIMKKSCFPKYMESDGYKTARNLVAGQFNSDKFSQRIMSDIDFVRYGIDMDLDKEDQLKILGNTKYTKVNKHTILDMNTDNHWNAQLATMGDEYNIDGLVIDVDSAQMRKKLGRHTNGNPKYAIALKLDEWNEKKISRVTGIRWQISKDGYAVPVININPIELSGVTITNISGYNAAYVADNHICKNALIEVKRSGEVIPKHLQTLTYNAGDFCDMMDDMIICPSCGEVMKWNENFVEMVCDYPDCEQKIVSEVLFFFKTMGIEEIGRPTIQKLYNAGYRNVHSILSMEESEWLRIDGLGKESFLSFRRQLLQGKEIPLARLLTALNIFHGNLGEKVCQQIFNAIKLEFINNTFSLVEFPLDELTQIDGVGLITAKAFTKGIREFSYWGRNFPFELFNWYIEEKTSDRADVKKVCFSGFRDKELEGKIKSLGHEVVSGVSKKLDLLIVKDISAHSSKITMAENLGVKILPISEQEKIWEFLG